MGVYEVKILLHTWHWPGYLQAATPNSQAPPRKVQRELGAVAAGRRARSGVEREPERGRDVVLHAQSLAHALAVVLGAAPVHHDLERAPRQRRRAVCAVTWEVSWCTTELTSDSKNLQIKPFLLSFIHR